MRRTVTGMDTPPAGDCPGIRIVSLTIDPQNALILVVTEPLGCPACGRDGTRWTIPVFQDRILHREADGIDPVH